MAGFSTAHNQARGRIPVPNMTWSTTIAKRAQRHAENCALSFTTDHPDDAGYGMLIVQRDNQHFGCGMAQCPDGVTVGSQKNETMKQLWTCFYDGGKIEYGKKIY